MNKRKKLLSTFFLGVMAYVVNYGITLYLTPFITKSMGTEAYGFITLSKNFASYVAIVTTALNSYASRFIAIEYHKGNVNKAQEYFSSVFLADAFLGICIMVFSLAFIFRIDHFLNIPSDLQLDIQLLFVLTFLNLCINTSGTALQTAGYIKNKLDITYVFRGLSYVVEAMTIIFLYSVGVAHLWYVGVALVVSSMVIVTSNFYLTQKYTPELRVVKEQFTMSAVKELVGNGVWNALNSLGNVLNSGLDLIISNRLITSLAMGQISIAKTISAIFVAIYQIMAQPFQPHFLKLYAAKEKEKLIDEFKLSMKLSGYVSNIAFAGFVGIGVYYYNLWIPGQNIEFIYKLSIIAVLSSVLEGAIFPLYYIYTLTVKNKIPCFVTIAGGFANVLGMYILIKHTNLGAYAVMWTTAIVMIVVNGITNPIYMSHCLKVKWTTFYGTLGRHLISCVLLTTVFWSIGNLLQPSSWLGLIITAIIMTIIGTPLHFTIVFNKVEWKRIHLKFKEKRKK